MGLTADQTMQKKRLVYLSSDGVDDEEDDVGSNHK